MRWDENENETRTEAGWYLTLTQLLDFLFFSLPLFFFLSFCVCLCVFQNLLYRSTYTYIHTYIHTHPQSRLSSRSFPLLSLLLCILVSVRRLFLAYSNPPTRTTLIRFVLICVPRRCPLFTRNSIIQMHTYMYIQKTYKMNSSLRGLKLEIGDGGWGMGDVWLEFGLSMSRVSSVSFVLGMLDQVHLLQCRTHPSWLGASKGQSDST